MGLDVRRVITWGDFLLGGSMKGLLVLVLDLSAGHMGNFVKMY